MPYVNYDKVTDWTKDAILEKLATDDKWVERTIVMLYEHQTGLEKQTYTTFLKNEVGFQVADSKEFTAYAKQILAGRKLSEAQLRSARRPWHRGRQPIPTIAKYRGQVLDVIEAKAKAMLQVR